MKQAIGNYEGVRAITREEALAMIPIVFSAERGRVSAEWERFLAEWQKSVAKLGGLSPDWRAVNFIAADRHNGVYSFVVRNRRGRKEIWFYNGDTCPDAKTVEV